MQRRFVARLAFTPHGGRQGSDPVRGLTPRTGGEVHGSSVRRKKAGLEAGFVFTSLPQLELLLAGSGT